MDGESIYPSEAPLTDYEELVSLINRENEVWVQAARRISPEILIEFLDLTDRRLYEHFRKLDPHALAVISVAWASEDLAPHWFDIAREYTEKWLHQQHIREAVDLPLLTGQGLDGAGAGYIHAGIAAHLSRLRCQRGEPYFCPNTRRSGRKLDIGQR
jgi:hypothetical protein